ncbi:MAG: F0F1 ATP synthase subunit epsilon [Desulfuromonadales bacterium]|nr:F0F1 ATP synthase subunit epsilon [Desulfuromonadales bacterium]MDT8422661.1 F0F1 ATP synthase subunit epsilon [Desulfuromonadales bacterium]
MAEKLKLEMVTPHKLVLSEEVDEITAPGAIGEFGVLPGHTPMLTTLKVGELTYRQGNQVKHVAVNWGYVEVEDDNVTVLVETAEMADKIDLERARAALSRAENALKTLSPDDKQFKIMEAALTRALMRIQIATRHS